MSQLIATLPAADAVAADARQRRLGKIVDARQRLFGHRFVTTHRLPCGTHVLELRDVGAGDEAFSPRRKDDEAHPIVLLRGAGGTASHMSTDKALCLPGC